MKHLIALLLVLTGTTTIVSAQDTLYINSENKPITKKKNAHHFKVTTKTDTGYVVEFLNKEQVLYSKTTYQDSEQKIMHGYSASYHGNTKGHEGRYLNGKQEGIWKYYHGGGAISAVVNYKDNILTGAEYFKRNGEKETDPKKIEQLPSFPGGPKALGDYMIRTLRYPKQALTDRASGQVRVGFTVATTGDLMDVRIVKGVNDDLNREAIRVVKGMPRWTPGVQFARPVKVAYTLPVNFSLN